MESIIVFGAGGHAKAVIDVIEKAGIYSIVGLIDSNKPVGTKVYGYSVLGNDDWIHQHHNDIYGGIVAIGDNFTRASITAAIKSHHPNFAFTAAIHPSASIARGASIGDGTVLMAGAIVGSDAVIGEQCVLYSGASIDHDSVIDSFVSFAPRAATGGNVRIGTCSAIAIGATIIHGRAIGEHSVIGAGSTVISDIPAYTVAYGTPAKAIRTRMSGESYL